MCPAGKTNGIQNKKDPGSYQETKATKISFKQIINDYGLKQTNFKLISLSLIRKLFREKMF
jgi:hypothetical protein